MADWIHNMHVITTIIAVLGLMLAMVVSAVRGRVAHCG